MRVMPRTCTSRVSCDSMPAVVGLGVEIPMTTNATAISTSGSATGFSASNLPHSGMYGATEYALISQMRPAIEVSANNPRNAFSPTTRTSRSRRRVPEIPKWMPRKNTAAAIRFAMSAPSVAAKRVAAYYTRADAFPDASRPPVSCARPSAGDTRRRARRPGGEAGRAVALSLHSPVQIDLRPDAAPGLDRCAPRSRETAAALPPICR